MTVLYLVFLSPSAFSPHFRHVGRYSRGRQCKDAHPPPPIYGLKHSILSITDLNTRCQTALDTAAAGGRQHSTRLPTETDTLVDYCAARRRFHCYCCA